MSTILTQTLPNVRSPGLALRFVLEVPDSNPGMTLAILPEVHLGFFYSPLPADIFEAAP